MAVADKCKVCKFFNDKDTTCRFEAPIPPVSDQRTNKVGTETNWPIVQPTDWCGRFVAGPYKG